MDNQEAKFILMAYRSNGADAADPMFAEALAQAQRDPSLNKWLAREQAFDGVISAKLAQTPPPPGLRQAILTGGRVSTTASAWWRYPRLFALAAALAVLASVGLFSLRYVAATEETRFASFAVNDLIHGTHGGHGEPTAQLEARLSTPNAKLTSAPPLDFEALRTSGCRTLDFHGHEVLEICLHRVTGVVHLYITRRGEGPVAGSSPHVSEKQGVALASWSDARHNYLALTTDGKAALEQIL